MQVVEQRLQVGFPIPMRNDHRRPVSPVAVFRAEITARLHVAVFKLNLLQARNSAERYS